MSAIQMEAVGTLRYAPEGANTSYHYRVNGQSDLTLGQLIMSVCLQRAALDESMSVLTMNHMNATASKMAATANVLEQVMTDGTTWETTIDIEKSGYRPLKVTDKASLKEFLEIEIGVEELPADLNTCKNRLLASDKIKVKVDELNRSAEEYSVRLQSEVGRRDTEYRTSAATVYSIGQAGMTIANAILGE